MRMLRGWVAGWTVVLAACSGGTTPPVTQPVTHQTPAARVDPTMARALEPLRPAHAPLDAVLRIAPAYYCGGAMVNPDDVPPPPAPNPNHAVVVVAGDYYHDGAPAAAVTTAADGAFTATLPPGHYCVVAGPRGRKPGGGCALTEWERCTAVVEVPVANVVAVDEFTPCWDPCNPPKSPPP